MKKIEEICKGCGTNDGIELYIIKNLSTKEKVGFALHLKGEYLCQGCLEARKSENKNFEYILSEKTKWKKWIKRIVNTIKSDERKEEFYQNFNKHIREKPSDEKFFSSINMLAVLCEIDGYDLDFYFSLMDDHNYKQLSGRLHQYKDKYNSEV